MAQKDPSRTERATRKRLDKARKKGSVAKSQELPKIIVLFTGVMVLYFLIGHLGKEIQDIFTWSFKTDSQPSSPPAASTRSWSCSPKSWP
jgi:flagellar biosynthetic protein FlhB